MLKSSEDKNKWVQVRHIKEKQYVSIIKRDICIKLLDAGLTLCLALKFHCAITCIMANKSSFKNEHTQYVLSICCSVLSGRCVGPGAAEAPIHEHQAFLEAFEPAGFPVAPGSSTERV